MLAESEEEAIQKIEDGDYEDILDEDPFGDLEKIKITGHDELEDD